MGDIPFRILEGRGRLTGAGISAEHNNNRLRFGWDETEDENVFATTVVAFQGRFTERRVLVKRDVAVLGAHEMSHDVGSRSARTRVTEPLLTNITSHYASRVMNATIAEIENKSGVSDQR